MQNVSRRQQPEFGVDEAGSKTWTNPPESGVHFGGAIGSQSNRRAPEVLRSERTNESEREGETERRRTVFIGGQRFSPGLAFTHEK